MKEIITLLLIWCCTFGIAQTSQTTAQYQGTYTYNTAKANGAHGSVMVYPQTDSIVLIYLYVNSGEQSYRSSELYQQLEIVNGKSVYTPPNSECSLSFQFNNATLSITIVGGNEHNCTLSDGIAAEYKKVSNEKPESFKNMAGKKISFRKNKL